MTRVLKGIGDPYMLSRVRRQHCATTGCEAKTRMAIGMILADIGEDGGPGMGAIVQCGVCIEQALVKLTDDARR